jgi:hypothetical protein
MPGIFWVLEISSNAETSLLRPPRSVSEEDREDPSKAAEVKITNARARRLTCGSNWDACSSSLMKEVNKRMRSWRVALLRIAEKDRSRFQIVRRDNADYQPLRFIQDLDQDLKGRDIRPSMIVTRSHPQATGYLKGSVVIGKVEAQELREDHDLEV